MDELDLDSTTTAGLRDDRTKRRACCVDATSTSAKEPQADADNRDRARDLAAGRRRKDEPANRGSEGVDQTEHKKPGSEADSQVSLP